MTRATVTCPLDGTEHPVDVTFPMTPHGPVLNIEAPELVEHMRQHVGEPLPDTMTP